MKATILTVGDEILIGQVTDTNATFMAAALTEAGHDVLEHLSVADTHAGITSGLDRALNASGLVLMTGGLGPTKDDITKQVISDYFATELVFHEPTWVRLQALIRGFGREPAEIHKAQCFLPAAATILTNERGTAPGMWLEKDGKILVSMPGVPYEMRRLVRAEVLPRLQSDRWHYEQVRNLTILTAGVGESIVSESIAEVENSLPEHMSLAYLPNLGTVRLRLTARGEDRETLDRDLEFYRRRIEGLVGELIYGYGNTNLARVLQERLQKEKKTLATAESCTGGSVAATITAEAGSSGHFRGSIIAYANGVKHQQLGVPPGMIHKYGAVSRHVVRTMATGARERLGVDYAIATSGVAGPGGGTEAKPVGTIWIAVATPEAAYTKLLRAGKDRKRNVAYTVHQSLNFLRRVLDGLEKP